MKLEAGNAYVIDMKSTDLDSYLKLHDPAGKPIAENDDIAENNQDSLSSSHRRKPVPTASSRRRSSKPAAGRTR
jgi:hypothetical protein